MDFIHRPYVFTPSRFVAVKLHLNSSVDLNKLHLRALEVYNTFGFRIAYELSSTVSQRKDSCSLLDCRLNGECQVEIDPRSQNISKFWCSCSYPNRPEIIERKFKGEKCGTHEILNECSTEFNTCSNNGKCRYLSSRHVLCDCNKGFSGKFCEIKNSQILQAKNDINKLSPDNCKHEFIVLTVNKDIEKFAEGLAIFFRQLEISSERPQIFLNPKDTVGGKVFIFSEDENFLRNQLREKIREFLWENRNRRLRRNIRVEGENKTYPGLCIKKKLTLTPDVIFSPGDTFHLGCEVDGPPNITYEFQWRKDERFFINTSLAKRFIGTSDKTARKVGYLYIKEVHEADDGIFKCIVSSDELANLKRYDVPGGRENSAFPVSLPFRTSVSVSRHVVVTKVPDIEVYPRTLTFLKGQDSGTNDDISTFHCLANKDQMESDTVGNLDFKWLDSKGNDVQSSDGVFVEKVFLPLGDTMLIYGLLLRVKSPKTDLNFTCEVFDKRSGHLESMKAKIQVRLFVAESEDDLCERDDRNGMIWPRTKKNTEAWKSCPFEQPGFIIRKCNPSLRFRPMWSPEPSNTDCVQRSLVLTEASLSNFLSGYLLESHNEESPLKFFNRLHEVMDSRPLHDREWNIINRMTKEILWYLKKKSLVHPKLSEFFFKQFITWLTKYGIDGLEDCPDERYSDIFELVVEGSKNISSSFEIGKFEVQNVNSENPDATCDTWIHVEMTRLNMPVHNLSFNLDKKNDSCLSKLPQVQISSSRKGSTKPIQFSVVSFPKVEQMMKRRPNMKLGILDQDQFVSPIVTLAFEILQEEHIKRGEEMNLTAIIEFPISGPVLNKTKHPEIVCARLNHTWELQYNGCNLISLDRVSNSVRCLCSKSGSYAIVWVNKDMEIKIKSVLPDALPLSLACGMSLAMTFVTLAMLSRPLRSKPRSSILWIQVLITLALSAVLIVILCAVLDPQTHLHWWTSLLLQFLFLVVLILQVLYSIVTQGQSKLFSKPSKSNMAVFFCAFAYPILYVALLSNMDRQNRHQSLEKHLSENYPKVVWFIFQIPSLDFYAFVASLVTILMVYAFSFCIAIKMLRKLSSKKLEKISNDFVLFHVKVKQPWSTHSKHHAIHDLSSGPIISREALLKRSCILTLTVVFFICACFVYTSRVGYLSGVDYLFSLATLLLGIVTFIVYVISSEGYLKEVKDFEMRELLPRTEVSGEKIGQNQKLKPGLVTSFHSNTFHCVDSNCSCHKETEDFVDFPSSNKKLICKCKDPRQLERPTFPISNQTSNGSSIDKVKPNFSSQSSYRQSSSGESCHKASNMEGPLDDLSPFQVEEEKFDFAPLQLSPVKCLLTLDNNSSNLRSPSSEQLANKESKLKFGPNEGGPAHLTEIVHQAQEEAAVELIAQLAEGAYSKSLVRTNSIRPTLSSVSSNDESSSGYIPKSRRTTSSASCVRTPSVGSSGSDCKSISDQGNNQTANHERNNAMDDDHYVQMSVVGKCNNLQMNNNSSSDEDVYRLNDISIEYHFGNAPFNRSKMIKKNNNSLRNGRNYRPGTGNFYETDSLLKQVSDKIRRARKCSASDSGERCSSEQECDSVDEGRGITTENGEEEEEQMLGRTTPCTPPNSIVFAKF